MSAILSGICSVCGQSADDIRVRIDDGCYGPVDVHTCRGCHEKDAASRRAESKRLGFRLKVKRWESLTTKGAYSQVRLLETRDTAGSPNRAVGL